MENINWKKGIIFGLIGFVCGWIFMEILSYFEMIS